MFSFTPRLQPGDCVPPGVLAVSQSSDELGFRNFALLDNTVERASRDLRMIRHRHGDSSTGKISPHDNVTARLPDHDETVLLENFANLTS